MSESKNKELMQSIFAELSKGNDSLFTEAMADEMKWIWMGSGQWSKTFDGKNEILGTLWSAVRETLKPPYKLYFVTLAAISDLQSEIGYQVDLKSTNYWIRDYKSRIAALYLHRINRKVI